MHHFSRHLLRGRKTFQSTWNSFIISSNQNNINLFTLAGSPIAPGNFLFTLNSGIAVGSTSNATAGLRTGTFPVGSIVKLINLGIIDGKEGITGAINGGPALQLDFNLILDNTNGLIGGGGGRGGDGGAGRYASGWGWVDEYWTSDSTGEGLIYHPGYSYTIYTDTTGGTGGAGQGSGNRSAAASGSAGGTNAGNGGNGGAYGASGSSGGNGTNAETSGTNAGSAGGTPGNAIVLSGKTITWLGGNDSTHVKGTVS